MANKAHEGACFELRDSFACQECAREEKFAYWAAAHWDEGFAFICPQCETKTVFEVGEVVLVLPNSEQ